MGIDILHPRFSWTLDHPRRSQTQSAYRIIVCSSSELAYRNIGDIWDSSEVASRESFGVPYSGPPLRSAASYWWRVMWRDSQGHASDFSEPAYFMTGLLEPGDWRASWISMREPQSFSSRGSVVLGRDEGEYIQYLGIYLRKEFILREPVRSATAFVYGLGCHELRINGRKVGDAVLDPAQTDYSKIALYSAYDVSKFLGGENAVGIILGNGRYIEKYGYGKPRAILQIHVELESGDTELITTDESWTASHGALRENGLYFGEHYDARRELPGWDEPGLLVNSREPAELVEGPPLSAQLMPPVRVVETIKPIKLLSPRKGVHILDFGGNFSGWARLRVTGPTGSQVRLRYAELLNGDGTLNTATNDRAEATDSYTLIGKGLETWEPRFTYHGFRYVEITGYPGAPSLDSLEGCFVHSDVETVGKFFCTNDAIDHVHENVIRCRRSNLMSIPTDCPQRDERHGWLGDAHIAAEESIFNFEMAAFYTNFVREIALSQAEEGGLPDIVPGYIKRLYPADPAWGSAFITIAWLVHRYYGDRRILEANFEGFRKYIEFLRSHADGHVQRKLGKYGDWCPPGAAASKKTPVELVATWFYYHDTLLLSRIAAALGRRKEERTYADLAARIRDAFNAAFLRENQYAALRNGPVDNESSQTSNLLPLHLGMVPPQNREAVLATLIDNVERINDKHLDTGIVGTRYLLEVLCVHGHADLAYAVATQESYPGWGYMIAEGATTLWERWEKKQGGGMNSQNHIMFGSVDAWFYRFLAGIEPLEPGWRRISVKPHTVAGLDAVEAATATPLGGISVAWKRTEFKFELTVRIPVGAEADVSLPLFWEKLHVYESGRKIWPASDRTQPDGGASEQDGRLRLTIGSGTYSFLVLSK